MKEHPILFSAEMVRAILEGRKTQTRRVIKPQPTGWNPIQGNDSGIWYWCVAGDMDWKERRMLPYGQIGDRLWVRETWAIHQLESAVPNVKEFPNILYKADSSTRLFISDIVWKYCREKFAWRPSRFMPRWASRITLEVVNVRVERAQEISEGDIIAEGCPSDYLLGQNWYKPLWNSINEKRGYGWDLNPWVWVIEFRKVKQ